MLRTFPRVVLLRNVLPSVSSATWMVSDATSVLMFGDLVTKILHAPW